ncbi:MAG: hypothetical protein AB7S94_01735 [Simkaniaceae bacterium]
MAWLIPTGVKNAFGYGPTQHTDETSPERYLEDADQLFRDEVDSRMEHLSSSLEDSTSLTHSSTPVRTPSHLSLSSSNPFEQGSVFGLSDSTLDLTPHADRAAHTPSQMHFAPSLQTPSFQEDVFVGSPRTTPKAHTESRFSPVVTHNLGETKAVEVLQLNASPELEMALTAARETIGNDTSAWAETRKFANNTVGKFDNPVARFLMHGVMAVVGFLAFATFQGKSWAKTENANRALLRNPTFVLPEHLQKKQFAQNRGVEAIAQKVDSALFSNKGALVETELQPQLDAWTQALEAVGKNLPDEEYRALIAVATQNVVDQMKGLSPLTKNFIVDHAATFYGSTAPAHIAREIAQEMTESTLFNIEEGQFAGIAAIHDKIAARAALIASVTGRDADEVEKELYTALNANETFTNKLQRFENNAYAEINKARNLEALKASFIADRIATLRSLALFSVNGDQSKGTGEEYLKLLLSGDELGGPQAAALFGHLMGVQNLQGRMEAMRQDKGKITDEFQRMFNFLDNLEEDFAAYVEEHEAKAEAQLARLVALDGLRGEGTYPSVEDLVDQEGLEAPQGEGQPAKIRTAIDVRTAKADPVSDEKLREIFDILMGTGEGSDLGAPTMARRFVGTLADRGKLQFADEEAATTDALLGLTRPQLNALFKEDASHLVLPLAQGRIPMLQFGESIEEVRRARQLIEVQQVAVDQVKDFEVDNSPVNEYQFDDE